MKTLVRLFFIIAVISLVAACNKTDEFFEETQLELKKAKIKVMPSMAADVLVKAEEDWNNINDALQNAGSGEIVQLAEGLFYLHKSIIRKDFNGNLRGSGVNETTIQTVPGELFDVSGCPKINWTFEENDGGFMFCFPHDFTDDERTVTVSDLSIVVSEPTTPYLRWKNSDKEKEFNSLQAINVFYTKLDNDLANPIDLNVLYKNISITGEKDEKYLNEGLSIFHGLTAYGLSNGTFEAKNVYIENAAGCITPFAFYGDDATVTVKNSSLKSCVYGIYSFLNHSWTILNNDIEDSKLGVVMLKQNPLEEIPEGPDGVSSVKNNRIHFEYTLGLGVGIQNVNNVEIKNNTFVGSSMFGGIGGAGAINGGENWIVKDNDLCGVVPQPPFNCTIWLNRLTNSQIKNNANQVIGGPGALEPTNIIGEGRECDE
ncbi:right-handed parallel beta-helix repeat-containing protein [Mariniphaga sp.]|uniref:right-handed parallel beta-helix repeat-containing protein n=1 Tax=Mariniphaga sp. TaxID=1954475 RepID=UPI0035674ACE